MTIAPDPCKRTDNCGSDPSPKRQRGVNPIADCPGAPGRIADWGSRRRHGGLAFSLAEVLVSLLVVSTMLVAALNMVGDATIGQQKTSDRGRGQLLAQDLMIEILAQSYEEPVDPPTFGREATESDVSRANYDDVDDYDGWDASPPEQKDDTEIPDLNGWRRSVTVEYLDPNDLTAVAGNDLGIKRITVTVKRGDVVAVSMVAVRTAVAEQFEPPK